MMDDCNDDCYWYTLGPTQKLYMGSRWLGLSDWRQRGHSAC